MESLFYPDNYFAATYEFEMLNFPLKCELIVYLSYLCLGTICPLKKMKMILMVWRLR